MRRSSAVRIIDRDSANDPQWEPLLENADLIYFSGGDPGYLYQTMKDSCAWSAAQRAWERGAIYAGCSAGAMILGKRMPSFRLAGTQEGFGIVPATYHCPALRCHSGDLEADRLWLAAPAQERRTHDRRG